MLSSPKVLIVDFSNNYGGSSSRVLSLIQRAKPGTVALAGLQFGDISKQAIKLGLPIHIISQHKADPRIMFRLVRIIRQGGYNILDSQNIQSRFWSNLAAIITKTALVSTLNSWYASEQGESSFKGKLYTVLEAFSNRSLDLYITVSAEDRQSLLKTGFPEDAIELIYNAVDINISEIAGDSVWLREKFDLPLDSMICTAVGRLVRIKGHDVLVDAIQKIATRVPHLFCLIVGEGVYRAELSERIQRAGLEDRIRLVGYYDRQNTLSILKSSDIFVMPSRHEGTPLALLEAAALARPILASSTGGIPELVTHDQHALLAPPDDSTALAQGLLKLSVDRDYAQMIGRNAQQRVEACFNLESQVSATWNAYQKALNRHRAREK
jgi:glycosyltransferase involved in cell wall biosynthesis